MCKRICLSRDIEDIRRQFAVAKGKPRLAPHWNIAAGAVMPVIRCDGPGEGACGADIRPRRLDLMRWGLVTAWAQNTRVVRSNFHAASGGMPELAARLTRRCLVPVESFYEWRSADKQPFAVALKSRQMMALAGVWDFWVSPLAEQVACFALITTEAQGKLAPLSRRMPLMLLPSDWDPWLDPQTPQPAVWSLLGHSDDAGEMLDIWPVNRCLSNLRNDHPDMLAPVAALQDH